jgi:LysR family transcriptional regulator for metE and metH
VEIEIRHLQLVTAVAALGGLTKAGRHLHLSQSALSHQLRGVEARLGTPLFLRVGKRMVPTAAGERLVKSAEEILLSLAGVEQAIQRLAGGEHGRLRVVTAGYVSYHWLPAVLKRYRTLHPNIQVQIPDATAADPVGELLAGSADLAIGAGFADDRRLHLQPILRDEVVCAVATGHRFADAPFVELDDVAVETVFVSAADRDSGVYHELIARPNNESAVNVVCVATTAAVELVKANLGVAIAGRWVVAPQVRDGTLRAVRLTPRGVWRQWHAATLKDLAASDHVRDFLSLAAREMARRSAAVSP